MSNEEYRPKSPDFSAFFSSGPEPAFEDPSSPFQAAYHQPLQSAHSATYNSQQEAYNNLSPYTPGRSHSQQYFPPTPTPQSRAPPPYYSSYAETPSNQYQPPTQTSPLQPPQLQTAHLPPAHGTSGFPQTSDAMPPRKAAQVAQQPEIAPSPVRTKFPTARIKRIMQADEEVGKVAQQTPIAVGKALELFMVQIVQKSAEVARAKDSKRISAQMLKQAVDSNNEWDFLRDIVSKVSDEKENAKGSRAKAETDSDEDVDMAEVKKKGRGGRKKKTAA